MVIHSSPGAHRKKPTQKKQENKQPVTPKKEVILEQSKAEEENILFDEIFAAEVKPEITSLPKKQNRKKVTKIIEE